ncbi:MAG TPA: helix-turn-helix domain-containing protein [Opitutaceae bacterium]
MQSIGERLEEARKRRGISVREAAEGTKIRGDFLLGFENNQFDTGLPDLYVRGFLRNYAQFIKADAEKIVTDYNAILIGETKVSRKENRELFGRMEIPEQKRAAPEAGGNPSQTERRRPDDGGERKRDLLSPEVANYVKIGAIVLAGILAVVFIVWLVQLIIHSASSPEAVGGPSASQVEEQQAPLETVTLIALDTVAVKVTQESDGRELFSGPLAKGETRQIAKRGRIIITYDAGRNLHVEKSGKRFQMPRDDYGRSYFE